MNPIETELKFMLDDDSAVRRLEACLGEPSARLAMATRYWLPAAPAGVALRLREIGGATEATIKRGREVPRDGLFINDEQTEQLDAGVAVACISGEQPLETLPLVAGAGLEGPFRYVGLILTQRHVYTVGDLPLEIDRVTYPDGGTEFEVEVEVPDADARRGELAALAAEAGVTLTPSTRTKLGRLLDRMAEGPRT
jgi:hypothetical protein